MRMVAVHFHSTREGWWAESPEIPGWTCVGATPDEVRDLAKEGVRAFVSEDAVPNEHWPSGGNEDVADMA